MEEASTLPCAAVTAWGRVDNLINNAARTKFNPYPKLDGVSKQDFLAIYAVNVVDGTLRWSRDMGAIVWASPVLGEDRVFVTDLGGSVSALNTETGEVIWSAATGEEVARLHGHTAGIIAPRGAPAAIAPSPLPLPMARRGSGTWKPAPRSTAWTVTRTGS